MRHLLILTISRSLNLIAIGAWVFFLSSCSSTKNLDDRPLVIYPDPPDTTRIQFLKSFSSSADLEQKRSRFTEYVVGEEQIKMIGKPYGVFISDGKIYVCDQNLSGLEIIDLESQTFEHFIPGGFGKLQLPINCFVDEKKQLYVADAQRKQIVVFDSLRNFIGSMGNGDEFKPTDVQVDGNSIYVVDIGTGNVLLFNREDLSFNSVIISKDIEGEGHLFNPTNIYLTSKSIYVSDFGDFKVKEYDREGNFLRSVGSYGRGPGQFVRPKGIAVDLEDNLYVVDAAFENVQIFNSAGQIRMFFGGSYAGPGDMYLPARINIDYHNLEYFQQYVDPSLELHYLILVSNQFGPDKINVYGYVSPKIP